MKVYLVSPGLVVLEAEKGEREASEAVEREVSAALEEGGLQPWGSVEVEQFTYRGRRLIFAKPVRVFIPDFLRLLN